MAALENGAVVSGKYRIERKLGEGGIGVVYAATHVELEQPVALKFLKPAALADAEIVARFAQEARAAVRLRSEHVARVVDVGNDAGVPFIVMEYLEGMDLEQVVSANGPLPLPELAEYMIQACEALSEAHARGIVHRDVKPENLFLVDNGEWKSLKMLDFGISQVALGSNAPDSGTASRRTQSIMGSPYYMSPEQLRSTRDVDHRADIWSLGATMFETYTGRTAFPEDRVFTELVVDIVGTRHRSLTQFRQGVPPDFEAIVDRCLEKDRELRFQSAAELAIALLPFAPRRARAVAERAVALSRQSGKFPTVSLPDSLLPPSSGIPSSGVPLHIVSAPPSRPNPTGGTSLSMATMPTQAPPPEPAEPVAAEAGSKRRPFVALALLALVLSVGAGIFVVARGTAKPTGPVVTATATAATETSTIPSSQAPAPTNAAPIRADSADPPGAAATPSVSAAVAGSTSAKAGSAAPPRPLPAPRADTPAPPSTPKSSSDLDIRLER